ncbi:MAG TPA: DUF4159 domain-containing protein [Vicinamibacterales bacterium]|nr:DUF4159 domain-containing protein [Vicinamibacterales bacterium]
MKRLLWSFVLCSLFLAAGAEAQRGFRGGWGGEAGAPPKFPSVTDFDGSWHFCRLMYRQVRRQQRGLGWGTDYPNADINFSTRLSELTKTQVGRDPDGFNHLVVRPTDPELFQCPFVMASDPGSAGFSPEDAEGLRTYLLKGGFLWVDDFWGEYAWESFIGEISKALPPGEFPVKDLTAEHPIYHLLFPFKEVPQVPSMQYWMGSGGDTSEMGAESAVPHIAAIADKQGRVMVLMTHNTDIADSWEREGDDPQFFFHFSPNGYAVGLNAVLYSMTH